MNPLGFEPTDALRITESLGRTPPLLVEVERSLEVAELGERGAKIDVAAHALERVELDGDRDALLQVDDTARIADAGASDTDVECVRLQLLQPSSSAIWSASKPTRIASSFLSAIMRKRERLLRTYALAREGGESSSKAAARSNSPKAASV